MVDGIGVSVRFFGALWWTKGLWRDREFGWISFNLLRTVLQVVSLFRSCFPKDYWIRLNFYWFCVDITCPAPHTLLHFTATRILFKKSTHNGILLFLFYHLNVYVILGCQSSCSEDLCRLESGTITSQKVFGTLNSFFLHTKKPVFKHVTLLWVSNLSLW